MTDGHDFQKTRREFLRNPFKRTLEEIDERRRTGVYRISDMAAMPPAEMSALKPEVVDNCEIRINEGMVEARLTFPLFEIGDDRLDIFNLFNGKTSVKEASRKLAAQQGIPVKEAYERVREMFLFLAERGICYPADPPEWT